MHRGRASTIEFPPKDWGRVSKPVLDSGLKLPGWRWGCEKTTDLPFAGTAVVEGRS